MKTIFCLLLLTISLSGCLITEWEDVSSDPKFSHLVGLKLVTKEPLRAHGITMKPNYEKVLDHYIITRLPGFSGPEVLSCKILPAGTVLKINKVVRCVDCLIKYEELDVEVLDGPKLEGAPSRFDYDAYEKDKNTLFSTGNT